MFLVFSAISSGFTEEYHIKEQNEERGHEGGNSNELQTRKSAMGSVYSRKSWFPMDGFFFILGDIERESRTLQFTLCSLQGLMTIGYDVCHDPRDKRRSYAAMVASMDNTCVRWISNVTRHSAGEELSVSFALNVMSECSMVITTVCYSKSSRKSVF